MAHGKEEKPPHVLQPHRRHDFFQLEAKCTVRVIQKSSQMFIQAHNNILEVLPRIINLYLSTRRPQNIGFPSYAGTGFFLSKIDSIFATENIVFRSRDG